MFQNQILFEEFIMKNKTVVITGGTKGIGKILCESFYKNGYHVIVGARNKSDIDQIDKKKISFLAMDVRDQDSHFKLVDMALKYGKNLDVWINNAGISSWRPIDKIDDSFFNNLMDVNLKGAFWGCKAASHQMQKQKFGSIINISSLAGKRGSKNNSMYCATKFGMNGLTQSLAKELGKFGIKVNAICPVLVKTEGLMSALESKYSPAEGKPELFLENFKNLNVATSDLPDGYDVANTALFLTSEKNKSITGQCINVDSGVFPQ